MSSFRVIYILFSGSESKHLKFLNKRFRHIECLLKSNNTWINICPRFDSLKISVVEGGNKDIENYMISSPSKILKVSIDNYSDFNRLSINPFNQINCVSTVKYIIGLRNFIFTPKQLYNYLIKMKLSNKFKKPIYKIEELENGNWK